MTNSSNQRILSAIAQQVSLALGSKLSGKLSIIHYPPGFHFNTQYGISAYYNPNTFRLLDQTCSVNSNGLVTMTGNSFSKLFSDILASSSYVTSSVDQTHTNTALAQLSKERKNVIDAYEDTFGRISKKMLTTAGLGTKDKIGYIHAEVTRRFPGSPPNFNGQYPIFAVRYSQYRLAGKQLSNRLLPEQNTITGIEAAQAHIRTPNSTNGALQTNTHTWAVAYAGLHDNNTVNTSLNNTTNTVTIALDLNQAGSNFTLKLGGVDLGSIPTKSLNLRLKSSPTDKTSVDTGLATNSNTIHMKITYQGLTLMAAEPVGLSANNATGWYDGQMIHDVATKTGKDVSGLQLTNSIFNPADMFGLGKRFNRVKTFVISKEPVIELTIIGTNSAQLKSTIKPQMEATLALGDVFNFGGVNENTKVQSIDSQGTTTKVILGTSPTVGTTPIVDQTAHIIGGVVEYPS